MKYIIACSFLFTCFLSNAFNSISGTIITQKSTFGIYYSVYEKIISPLCGDEDKVIDLECKGKGTNKGQFTFAFTDAFSNQELWNKGFEIVNKEVKKTRKIVLTKKTLTGHNSYAIIVKGYGTLNFSFEWDYTNPSAQKLKYKMSVV